MLIAVESARTLLAVAIASETKWTPPDRLQYYFETADQARRFTKRLRRGNFELVQDQQGWAHALERLKELPAQVKAIRLCQLLREIVGQLE